MPKDIKYETDNNDKDMIKCLTPCPYNQFDNLFGFGKEIKNVGSFGCCGCDFHHSQDNNTQVVKCTYED